MNNKLKNTINRLKGKVSFACAALIFAVVLIFTVRGIKNMSRDYNAVMNLDLSADARSSIVYDDHLYGQIGYGIEIDRRDSDNSARLSEFASSSLRAIDRRIISCNVTYTMLITAALAFWLYTEFGRNRGKHALSIFIAVFAVSAGLLAAVLITYAALRMPFCFPDAGEMPVLLVSIFAILGGSCFLGWMLRLFRFKRILSLAAVPLVMLLFMQGTVFEAGLFCSPEVPSFDYIAQEIEPRVYDSDFDGDVYYDEEKDVIVLNGAEYPPRQIQNPDYLTGTGRLTACIFEIISPYSGNGLFLLHETENITAGAAALSLYALKAVLLAVFPVFLRKRRQYNGDVRSYIKGSGQ